MGIYYMMKNGHSLESTLDTNKTQTQQMRRWKSENAIDMLINEKTPNSQSMGTTYLRSFTTN